MHLKEYIKEEKEGSRKYSKLAKGAALEKRAFKKMAKDEKGHAKKLKQMERTKEE